MSPATRPPEAGFTLIEVAIGLLILGLVTVGIVASLSQQAESRRHAQTRLALAEAREALLAFVGVNGRLPCPAVAATNGRESVAAVAGNTITCTAESGLLPAVTLGLPGLDTGGWLNNAWSDSGNPAATLPRTFRYAVSSLAAPVANALTSPRLGATAANTATRRLDVQAAVEVGQGLFVCASATGAGTGANRCGTPANLLASSAAVIVWTLGANGNDAAAFSADEQQNFALTVPRVVISRVNAPAGAQGGMFDDLVTWVPYSLVADRLVSSGFLP
ncbi:MAG: type II secretion system protein [Lautropia sp.]